MQMHIGPQNLWREHCEALARGLCVDLERHEVRIFKNMYQAVNEAMLGLRRQHTIKKKIYYFKSQSPHTDTPLKNLAKEGLQIEALPREYLLDPADFVSKIDRESHFVVYTVDEPTFGLLEDVTRFEAAIAEKALFKIRISSHRHAIEGLPAIDKNTIHVLGLATGEALCLLGEKVRFAPQGVELMDWSGFDPGQTLAVLKANVVDRKESIQNFEARTDLGFEALLPPGSSRIFDRAVIAWSDLDSAAMLESLTDKIGIKLGHRGKMDRLESLSLSRWGGTRSFDWLESRGFPKERLRGALVIDAVLLEESLIENIRICRKEILEAQSGD